MSGELGPVDRLLERAMTLAGAWEARARIATTVGQERALLRLFGVSGLDRAGRPLAAEVVDRYLGGGTRRLAGGIALPFAAALLEYEIGPQALALDVAAGTIDLGLEAEVLHDAGRRTAAEAEVVRLTGLALDRIGANRIARRELLDVLGDAPRPWIGVPLGEADAMDARAVLGGLVRDGADLAVVAVPVGRELADRLHDAGVDIPGRRPYDRPDGTAGGPDDTEEPPSGSQRGLAILRLAADEAAAERRRYVRLASTAPGLAAPEQAVVAAFERIDLVVADPVAEIVDGKIDPDRALADHSFAHRLHRRAGAQVLVGPGPLVVAPDMARGQPSDPLTRAGRALALQALSVALARHGGLTADQVVIGAFPTWLLDERGPTALAIAQVAVRRAVFEGHPAAFIEPPAETGAEATADARWPFVLAATLPYAGGTALILRDVTAARAAYATAGARAAASVAAEVAASSGAPPLAGPALAYAQATVTAALRTLERLADLGWRDVLGEAMGGRRRERLGADAVVERVEAFDPLSD
ncbi:MAG TPA: lysine 5,6-aminomutase subunit alpha [Candidatus Limnocylindrales bacterium]